MNEWMNLFSMAEIIWSLNNLKKNSLFWKFVDFGILANLNSLRHLRVTWDYQCLFFISCFFFCFFFSFVFILSGIHWRNFPDYFHFIIYRQHHWHAVDYHRLSRQYLKVFTVIHLRWKPTIWRYQRSRESDISVDVYCIQHYCVEL